MTKKPHIEPQFYEMQSAKSFVIYISSLVKTTVYTNRQQYIHIGFSHEDIHTQL